MKNLVKLTVAGLFIFKSALLAASPLSTYKQMGSVAALSEKCLISKKIPSKLQVALDESGLEQQTINSLIDVYNDGYKSTILSNKIWIASKETWSNKPFSCNSRQDIELIKKMENQIISTIQ